VVEEPVVPVARSPEDTRHPGITSGGPANRRTIMKGILLWAIGIPIPIIILIYLLF